MNKASAYATTHPIFRAQNVQILWSGLVMKKNRHGGLQQRVLVIASVGIFLFERRMFPRGLVLSRAISYGDLVLIRVDESVMEFFGPKVTIVCQHEEHVHVAAIVRAVRNTLFGVNARPTKVVVENPEIEKQMEADKFVFRSESILADRFLSLCLSTAPNLLVPDQVNYLYDMLKVCDGCFQFDAETMVSPLITPVSLAIAYDEKLEGIRLWDLNFPSFLQQYVNLILYNSSIHRVTFSSVSWNGPVRSYLEVWGKKTQFAVNQMMFNDCQLTTHSFRLFLGAFEKYPADMAKLAFVKCGMSKEVIEALFESLYVSPCFRTLADFSLIEVRPTDLLKVYIMQFLSSNFMLSQKFLNLVNFSDCCLDLDLVMPYFFKFETCLQSVTLSANTFVTSKGLSEIDDFQNVAELTLSNCTFTGEVLLKFFQVLGSAKRAPTNLVLDSLKIDGDDGWNTFYDGISDVKLKELKLLSWCNNTMTANQMQSFKTFLLNQPTVTDLGLSNSIAFSDADTCLEYLVEIVSTLTIERLELRASGSQTFGVKLINFLRTLLDRKTIKMLDVTGHGIGDIGLDIVTQLAESCLQELRFDGNSPSSYEVLLDRVKRVTSSPIQHADWPAEDAKEVTAKIPLSGRQQIMRQIEAARQQFEAKMNKHTAPKQEELVFDGRTVSRHPSILTRGSRKESMLAGTLPMIIDENIIGCCEPWVTSSLNEILNNKKLRDPLLVAVDELDATTSLTHYLDSQISETN